MEANKKSLAEFLRKFLLKGDFKLSSGETSDIYIDLKQAFGDPQIRKSAAKLLYENMGEKPTCIAATGFGGIMLATELSSMHNLKLTLIRDERKSYGTQKIIEGYLPTSEDIVFAVDDVFTTGESLKKVISKLGNANVRVKESHVIIKRGQRDSEIPLKYLFESSDLL